MKTTNVSARRFAPRADRRFTATHVLPPTLLAATLASLPGMGFALGLGDIDLNSALSERLDAAVELTSAGPNDLAGLEAVVPPREVFARYGLNYPEVLQTLNVRTTRDSRGRNILRITSSAPITEPMVTFLIEAEWPRGRLLREYTLLLDPPSGVLPATTNASAVVSARPSAVPSPAATSRPLRPAATPAAGAAGRQYGPVRPGESLWKIASSTRPDGADVNQTMVAIYRANPEAFDGDMSRLRAAVVLDIPNADAIRAVSTRDATAQVAGNSTRDDAARVRERAATSSIAQTRNDDAPQRNLDGRASEVTAVLEPAISDASLALSAEVSSLRLRLDQSERKLQARDVELARLERELQRLQAEVATLRGGATTVDATSPAAVAQSADAVGAAGIVLPRAGEALTDDAATLFPASTATSTAAVTTTADSGATPAAAARSPWVPLGAFALAVAGLLAGWARWRVGRDSTLASTDHVDVLPESSAGAPPTVSPTATPVAVGGAPRQAPAAVAAKRIANVAPLPVAGDSLKDVNDATSTTVDSPREVGAVARSTDAAVPRAPAEPSTGTFGTGRFKAIPRTGSPSLQVDEPSDPLTEADFYLAYDLHDQAADLIVHALEREPERAELQSKLLDLYFISGDRERFAVAAERYQTALSVQPGEWERVVDMGRQLCPDHVLFAKDDEQVATDASVATGVDISDETSLAPADYMASETNETDADDGEFDDIDLGVAAVSADDNDSTRRVQALHDVDPTVRINLDGQVASNDSAQDEVRERATATLRAMPIGAARESRRDRTADTTSPSHRAHPGDGTQ